MSRVFFCFLLSLGLVLPRLTLANSVSGSVAANVAVANDCQIETLDSLDMGAYQPLSGTPLVGSGQISLKCTKGAAVSVIPTSGGKAMTGTGGSLTYGLYTDSALSKVWGSGFAYINVNLNSTEIYFNNQATTSESNCRTLANGLTYTYYSPSSRCYYNLTNAATNFFEAPATSAGNSVVYYNGQVIYRGTMSTWYFPDNTVYSGGNYILQTTTSGVANPLQGTSASANTPISLNYYVSVPAQQDVSPGVYSDTVLVQVDF